MAVDKFTGGIRAGSVDVTIPVVLRKTADNTEQTAKVYTDVTGSYWRQGGTRQAITMATLGSVNAAHSDGGFLLVDDTNTPGLYRLDLPDAAVATGADWVTIALKVGSTYVFYQTYPLTNATISDLLDATVGAALVMYLKQLQIVNSAGDALVLSSTGSNGQGINASGNGTGAGMKLTGGATGNGLNALGGATSGSGVKVSGTNGNAIALELAGQGSAAGLSATGGATGPGGKFVGGSTSGAGVSVTTTSGDGVSVAPTAGHGLNLAANGTDKHGLLSTGGTAGTSDGIKVVAGSGGVTLRGGNVDQIAGSAPAATLLSKLVRGMGAGTVATGTSGALFTTTDLSPGNIDFSGQFLQFYDGTNQGETRKISTWSYNPTGTVTTFTFDGLDGNLDEAFAATPATGNGFVILGRG